MSSVKGKPNSAVICLLAGMIILTLTLAEVKLAYADELKIPKESIDILSRTNQAMADVVATVKPAVVNISTSKTIRTRGVQSPFSNDPFFRQFFGNDFGMFERPREFKQSALGSGVIVDSEGYILTNYHVVKEADEIKVKLQDKKEYKGKVIGSDQKTDLAVVKINARNLPSVQLGNSDKLRVGEIVIAVGNPFGLNQTVTSGIVSATGRANVGIADYEDFIQTDAPINPGNSGGALVNIYGQLVGINTAIFSTSGGYQGVGFAIPSNMAKAVMDNLIKKGKVVRGWFGVSVQPLTQDIAKQFGLMGENGALVADVTEDSPAQLAGIQRGDVILSFDGKEIDEPSNLRNMVAGVQPGREVSVKLMRNGEVIMKRATITELPSELQKLSSLYDNNFKGVHVQNITPEFKKALAVPKQLSGVVITDIDDDSPSAGILSKNDVIAEINKRKISGTKDYEAIVSGIKAGQDVLLLIYRSGSAFYLTLSAE